MMKLRELQIKDAKLMLEWMHDLDVIKNMQTNFAEKTLEDCERFIQNSWNDKKNLNLAIVNEKDMYMGTVSLKHINNVYRSAEFAITIRRVAMGKGYSKYAMKEILNMALTKMGLKKIYWCVSKENVRAVKFYDKNGYQKIDKVPEEVVGYTNEQMNEFLWYQVC